MSNTINNGGPAFPTENARQTGLNSWHEEGMTLRDYFAAKAMQGFIATDALEKGLKFVSPEENERLLAKTCYQLADAMLRARGEA